VASLLSVEMLQAVRKRPHSVYALLDLELPSGTRRYSSAPIKTPFGQYHGKIISAGSFFRSASGVDGRIIFPRLDSITIEDLDSELAELFELTKPSGSPVTVWMAAEGVHQDNWFRFVDNFVLDDWQQTRALQFTLSFSFNDLPFRSLIPRTPILRPDFPRAANAETYTHHVLLAYGVHDSSGVGDQGMVQTFYVDTANGHFGPWLGWIEVTRVFLDGVVQPSGWTVIHPIIGGRQYTLIEFASPPDPTTNPVVTADIIGYKDGTDGAGSLLTGAAALQHAFVNFIHPSEDWKRGAWFNPSTAPISTVYFEEMHVFLVDRGWDAVSRNFGGSKRLTGQLLFEQWCDSFGRVGLVGSFFTNDGKIAIRPNSHCVLELFQEGSHWVRYDKDEVDDSFSQPVDRHNLLDKVTVKFLMNSIDESFRWAIEVSDLSVGRNAADDLLMPWSKSQLS
jgi:hypothetical protein